MRGGIVTQNSSSSSFGGTALKSAFALAMVASAFAIAETKYQQQAQTASAETVRSDASDAWSQCLRNAIEETRAIKGLSAEQSNKMWEDKANACRAFIPR